MAWKESHVEKEREKKKKEVGGFLFSGFPISSFSGRLHVQQYFGTLFNVFIFADYSPLLLAAAAATACSPVSVLLIYSIVFN